MATKTFEELKQLAIHIRDEKTNKQNTATRVGTAMLEHLNKLEQDYYDKTATDEELKQRDEKLAELSSNLNGIAFFNYGISIDNTVSNVFNRISTTWINDVQAFKMADGYEAAILVELEDGTLFTSLFTFKAEYQFANPQKAKFNIRRIDDSVITTEEARSAITIIRNKYNNSSSISNFINKADSFDIGYGIDGLGRINYNSNRKSIGWIDNVILVESVSDDIEFAVLCINNNPVNYDTSKFSFTDRIYLNSPKKNVK